MKKRLAVLVAACGLMMLASCEWDEYQIQMTPKDGRLERQITVIRHGDKGPATLPADMLERLAAAYGAKPPPAPTTTFAAKGVFGPATPNDVGGAGRYQEFAADMGSVGLYAERFRGNDDLNAQLDARRKAVDEAVDLLIGWLESQLKAEPGWKDLRTFMDGQFRKDLANASMYFWTEGAALRVRPIMTTHPAAAPSPAIRIIPDEPGQAEMIGDVIARVALYFAERDYFEPKDLPEFATPQRFLHRILAARMKTKVGEPTGAWAFLASTDATTESLHKYLQTTEQYKKLQAAATEPAQHPDAMEVLTGPLGTAFAMSGGGTPPSKVMIALATPAAPMATNGIVSEDGKLVRWALVLPELGKGDVGPPPLAYAVWAVPAAKFQELHFGKAILEGQPLLDYVLRRNALSAKEAGEWDKFVASLKPGAGLAAKVEAFRFSTDSKEIPPGQTSPPPGKAGELTSEIVNALRLIEANTTLPAQ